MADSNHQNCHCLVLDLADPEMKIGYWVSFISTAAELARRHPEGPRFHQRAESLP